MYTVHYKYCKYTINVKAKTHSRVYRGRIILMREISLLKLGKGIIHQIGPEREKERDREMIYLPGVETLGKKRENDLYTVVGP
jgi:hypothetical protein